MTPMNNTVLPIEFENKLALLAHCVDNFLEQECDGTREALRYALMDTEIDNWLTAMRKAGRTPFRFLSQVRRA